MYTLKEINPARLNNPDAGEKTIFLDQSDSAVKTKDENGLIETLAVGASIPDGGTTGQVLAKASDTDGDTEWVDAGGGGPLVYKGLLVQSGTSDPTVTVLENTLGGTVVWARTGVGTYTGTLTGAFPANKIIGPGFGVGYANYVGTVGGLRQYALQRQTNNNIILYWFNSGTGLPAELNNDGFNTINIDLTIYP